MTNHRLAKVSLLSFMALLSAGCPIAPPGVDSTATVNSGAVTRDEAAPASASPIARHGGSVMRDTVNVYYIWYGNWSGRSADSILTNLAQNIGGSPFYNINQGYTDASGRVSGAVSYGGSITDSYSHGTSLSQADIAAIVDSSFDTGLPVDANGLYFVLTSSDVTQQNSSSSSFCANYCGWHNYSTLRNTDIKYAFVGDADACLSSCAAQSTGPNGDAGADAMASTLVHELVEAVTDPHLDAWYDGNGQENADKCAWTFGAEYTAGGARANMKLGAMDYLIQQNWVNDGAGYCALSAPPAPPGYVVSFKDIDDQVFVWSGTDASKPEEAIIQRGLGTNEQVPLENLVGPFDSPKEITIKLLNSGCFNSGGTLGILDGGTEVWGHVEAQLIRHCGWIYRVALRLNPDGTVQVLDEQACVNDFDPACYK